MLAERLTLLTEEFSRISELISLEKAKPVPDELYIHRMKKQQQVLQNKIDDAKSGLHPDIIA